MCFLDRHAQAQRAVYNENDLFNQFLLDCIFVFGSCWLTLKLGRFDFMVLVVDKSENNQNSVSVTLFTTSVRTKEVHTNKELKMNRDFRDMYALI